MGWGADCYAPSGWSALKTAGNEMLEFKELNMVHPQVGMSDRQQAPARKSKAMLVGAMKLHTALLACAMTGRKAAASV
eukprot:738969-Pelagomonas_calceolata.AAC.2